MKNRNPLLGKIEFDKKGNLWFDENVKFAGQLNPKVSAREWFYLLWEATRESRKKFKIDKNDMKKSWLGSSVTQWRTKKSLLAKGYLK